MLGIGGRTIEEAQSRMSFIEYKTWVKYRNLRGPLNPLLRLDRVGALVAAVQTGKAMSNYMPWSKDPGSSQSSQSGQGFNTNDYNPENAKTLLIAGEISTVRTVAVTPKGVVKSKVEERRIPVKGKKLGK